MSIDFKKYPLPGRMRHHTLPYLYLPASDLKFKIDYYPPCHESLNWKEKFINGRQPDSLDIGCGKGAFLIDHAITKPDKNILGIELRLSPVKWLETVIEGERYENCSAIWYSVANGLPFIEDNSVESVYYLFPDPWPKKRHQKRRAFNSNLLKEIFRILKNDGLLYLATDVFEVDESQREVLNENGNFNFKYVSSDNGWNLPRTNKEKFCISKYISYTRMICGKK